jgi:hypothetical protein
MKEFKPAKVRDRLAAAEHPGEELPDIVEYQVHSEALHVTPAHAGAFTGDGFRDGTDPGLVVFWLHEIFEHTRRVFLALDDLVALDPRSEGRPPVGGRLVAFGDAGAAAHEWVTEMRGLTGLGPQRERAPLPRGTRATDIDWFAPDDSGPG